MSQDAEYYDRENCYFCAHSDARALEEHHLRPKRFDGSDKPNNLVTVCANCHRKLEALYDKEFYQRLGVEKADDSDTDGHSNDVPKRVPSHHGDGQVFVPQVIAEISERCGRAAPIKAVTQELKERGLTDDEVSQTIEYFKSKGDVYSAYTDNLATTLSERAKVQVELAVEVDDYE